jgi:hypothetical protein
MTQIAWKTPCPAGSEFNDMRTESHNSGFKRDGRFQAVAR